VIGGTISHYRITEKLGEGGMGVVYKAEDTKLDRIVALKFLAGHLLNDEEAKARFLREAKAAAGLHHPNICPVHEIDEAEGRTFLSMAFLEGEPLEACIRQGPLPLKEALDIARQIAEGLEAAHEKSVVHRDIKPANVMVDAKGHTTIMDFGLARLTEASRLTKADQTMGTVAYMSPEQAQGMDVDSRSDIWALGVVLYEMIAGARPFKGEYDQALLYEIVHQVPEPLTGLRTGLPIELELLVDKCLAKEGRSRYQNAADLIVDLRTLAEKLASGHSRVLSVSGAVVGSGATAQGRAIVHPDFSDPKGPALNRTRERVAWASAAAAVVAALVLAFVHFTEPDPQLEATRFSIQAPDGVRFWSRAPEISPDGRKLAFIGSSGPGAQLLWVRAMDSLEARPLTGTEGVAHPFWSPDSRFLGFFADNKLKKIDITGGAPQILCDAPSPRGGTWAQGPDGGQGVIVFAPHSTGPLQRISDAGGKPTPVTTLGEAESDKRVSHRYPHFLPDGTHFLYAAGLIGSREVHVASLDDQSTQEPGSKRNVPLLRDHTTVRYAPPSPGQSKGYLLFARDYSLMAQEFDPRCLELDGQPFPIAEGVRANAGANPSDFSVSQTGMLAYGGRGGVSHQLVWFDRQGRRLGFVGEPAAHGAVSLSPDSDRVAVSLSTEASRSDIWIHDLSREVTSRFTFDPASDWTHAWSPDSARLAFSSTRGGGSADLYVKATSGAGQPELLLKTANVKGPLDWSRDGSLLLFREQSLDRGWDLWVLPLEGNREPVPYLQTKFTESTGQFSPDDQWVTYMSDESGQREIYVQPYPADGSKWQISTGGGLQPRWSADGKELFYLSTDGRMMVVEVESQETFRPGVPSALFDVPEFNDILPDIFYHYDVTNDGQRFLIDVAAGETGQVPVTVVLNWQAELGR
jgi:Tol biopolymer transport system component/tRNA A-37 threonylcarbamoyl transferase component Bud32